MGGGGVTDLVNGLHGRVDSRVKTNGVIRTCNVQVNGSRKSDCIDSKGGKLASAAEGTVAANHHNAVDSMLTADFSALLLAFRCSKLLASGCVKYGTALVDGVRYAGGLHIHDFLFQKSCVAAHDSLYLKSLVNCRTNHCADCRVHSRRIPAACKYSNGLHCLCHSNLPPCIKRLRPPPAQCHSYSFSHFMPNAILMHFYQLFKTFFYHFDIFFTKFMLQPL